MPADLLCFGSVHKLHNSKLEVFSFSPHFLFFWPGGVQGHASGYSVSRCGNSNSPKNLDNFYKLSKKTTTLFANSLVLTMDGRAWPGQRCAAGDGRPSVQHSSS